MVSRERKSENEGIAGGGVDFISLGHVMLCFRGTVKIPEVSLPVCSLFSQASAVSTLT